MLAEICTRWIAMKDAFFNSKGNLFDLVMAVLVGVLTVLMVVGWQKESKMMAEAEALVVIARNAIQAIRLWRLVDRYHIQCLDITLLIVDRKELNNRNQSDWIDL